MHIDPAPWAAEAAGPPPVAWLARVEEHTFVVSTMAVRAATTLTCGENAHDSGTVHHPSSQWMSPLADAGTRRGCTVLSEVNYFSFGVDQSDAARLHMRRQRGRVHCTCGCRRYAARG